tara:strand:- start:537 stop:1397 length:861 start_codon:yes stop_codon:yes gene_type:complete
MNILITGANGYLAKNLIMELSSKAKYKLILLVREGSSIEELLNYVNIKSIVFYNGNIESLNSLKHCKINLVFHLANYYPDSKRPAIPEQIINSNLTLIVNIVSSLGDKNLFKIINISSNAADYDSSLYGITKLATEKFLEENYNCNTYRLHDTYGKNDPRPKLINQLINYSSTGKILEMKSAPNKIIHLAYIKDVINAFVSVIENPELCENCKTVSPYPIKHIFSETLTLKEVIETFNKVSIKKVNVSWHNEQKTKFHPLKEPGELPRGWGPKYNLNMGLTEMLEL